MLVSSALLVVKFEDLAYNVAEHVRMNESDMITIPRLPPDHEAIDEPPMDPPAPSRPIPGQLTLPFTVLSCISPKWMS